MQLIQNTINIIDEIKNSLMQIIEDKGPAWCSRMTGLSSNTFSDLKLGKYNKWSDAKIIKVYNILVKEFKELS